MVDEMNKRQSKQTHSRVSELVSQSTIEEPERLNAKRERFLSLLEKRYGYSNEKAVDELDRLLKQFSRMNRSLGIHRLRTNFKPPTIG